ncbi:hypothetical protein [Anaeromyxobacter terrae]|uniref:hypothetical protein n=1 Tax=Anaeromyxobacter terrae TaxID=2925406 RepID=UPI001F59D97F|nr:hypothetical protein [Anaeromyxobacter sp. SG22]
MRIRLATLACLAALAAGCIHDEAPWREVGGKYDSGNWFGPRISMALPDDWMKLNHVDDGLVATRDGFNLQAIKIRRVDPGKPLPHTKKTVTKGMRPSELAEVLLDDLRSDGSVNGLKVLETRPASIAGAAGFRTTVAFKDAFGLKVRVALCGVLIDGHAWQIAYVAPARHYFEQDLATFDAALASFRVR